jgi:CheY-like chemotaxis protein
MHASSACRSRLSEAASVGGLTEAIELITRHEGLFDLLRADIRMPVMDDIARARKPPEIQTRLVTPLSGKAFTAGSIRRI